jgi:hypothetical protein
MATRKRNVPTFVATGAENRCVVTVRMLREEDSYGWMVEVDVKLHPETEEGSTPELWHTSWTHYADMIRDNFWPFIDRYCPEPDTVHEAIKNLVLPEELEGLFAGYVEVRFPKATAAAQKLLAEKKAQEEPEEPESEVSGDPGD